MTFEDGNLFSAASTEMIEKRLTGPKGDAVKAVQRDIGILGTFRIAGDRLVLTPRRPLAEDARAFATVNFGPAAADGSFAPRLEIAGGLALANPESGRRLRFQRHKRPVSP